MSATCGRPRPTRFSQFITDNFNRITLYENRVSDAAAKKLPDGRYQVNFTVRSQKFYADSTGNQRPAPEGDYVPVGYFPGPRPQQPALPPLLLTKRRLVAGDNKLQFVVAKKPASRSRGPLPRADRPQRMTTRKT
ncbi:MAG: hypothetical protein WKG07_39600 [Hymenobacter sp.]